MNQTIDVVEWLQERAFRMYGPTMEAAHTKTKEWLWADEITRLRADLAAERDRNRIITQSAQEVTNALRADNERLREALSYYAEEDYNGYNGSGACARAALEGVTEKEGAGNE